MKNEIITALREAARNLRGGGSNGKKIRLAPRQIKNVRQKLELTQEEFADSVGVSVQAVRSWEQGIRSPGALSLAIIGALMSQSKLTEHA